MQQISLLTTVKLSAQPELPGLGNCCMGIYNIYTYVMSLPGPQYLQEKVQNH